MSAAFYFDEMLGLQLKSAADASRLAAENERLRSALEPFARWAEALDRDFADHDDDVIAGGLGGHYTITFGDIRSVRAVLTPSD